MSFNPVIKSIVSGLKPDPYVTIDEWADNFRKLPRGASSEAGQYSTERMPYVREIMRELSPQSATQQVKVIKATQVGMSEVANNVALYYMDVVPSSQLMILPTEQLAKDHSNRKLTPSLRAMPYLSKRIMGGKSKDDIGGIFEKIYPGGMLKIAWAGSMANFRSLSCRVVILDDVDGFPGDVDGEGDPLDLAKKRADSFGISRKIFINSTPTVEGASNIEAEFNASDQRHYYMPCPFCSEFVRFEFEHFSFDYDKDSYELTSDPVFVCPKCGSFVEEHHKTEMMSSGKWKPHNPGHIHRGYRLPSYYSPIGFVSWRDIFREFLEARALQKKGDNRKMKVWVNTRDARVWKEEVTEADEKIFTDRCEEYPFEVPAEVKVITAGVDTQDDRFEIEVVGWGDWEETWSIDYRVIHGDPQDPETLKQLDQYLMQTFDTEGGRKMKIYAAAIDRGGHRSKAIDGFCRNKLTRRIFAVFGSTNITTPPVPVRSSKSKHKTNIFRIGVNALKDDVYAKIVTKAPGPNYMHFPQKGAYDEEYFRQLTAERRDSKGRWEKKRPRNEAFDCRVYATAALLLAGVDMSKISGKEIRLGSIVANERPRRERKRKRTRSGEDWSDII